jgi:ubiquinone/menaquinone biosynthesis C-methylase UbiE
MCQTEQEKKESKTSNPIVTNAENTRLLQESVDIVFLHLVLYDIKNKHEALKKFYRVLKKGGKLVIDEETTIPLDEIKKLVEDNGFTFLNRLRKTVQVFRKET